jgi:site-specific DNA-methyltransferase (adenine-specific)
MSELPIRKVVCGDCVEVMKKFPDNSIDCVVTDPPYGIKWMGSKWDQALPPKEAFQQMFRVLKPGGLALIMCSPRQDVMWRMLQRIEECGFELQQSFISWVFCSGFPKAYDVSKGIDRREGKKREVVGKRLNAYGDPELSKTRDERNLWGKKSTKEVDLPSDEPVTDLAKKWKGWKSITGLKPALECIIVANKPFSEKTIVDNVLKHGTGAINVDECRIPISKGDEPQAGQRTKTFGSKKEPVSGGEGSGGFEADKRGRFPANLIISDRALQGESRGAIAPVKAGQKRWGGKIYGKYKTGGDDGKTFYSKEETRKDVSRYFDLDFWFKKRVEQLPEETRKTFPFLVVPKASKKERDKGLEDMPNVERDTKLTYAVSEEAMAWRRTHRKKEWCSPNRPKGKNPHTAVKPVKLMSFLITLACPPDGIVLDPFAGSGSTLVAAEILGKKWIGIEINPEYCKIAEKRVESEKRE